MNLCHKCTPKSLLWEELCLPIIHITEHQELRSGYRNRCYFDRILNSTSVFLELTFEHQRFGQDSHHADSKGFMAVIGKTT